MQSVKDILEEWKSAAIHFATAYFERWMDAELPDVRSTDFWVRDAAIQVDWRPIEAALEFGISASTKSDLCDCFGFKLIGFGGGFGRFRTHTEIGLLRLKAPTAFRIRKDGAMVVLGNGSRRAIDPRLISSSLILTTDDGSERDVILLSIDDARKETFFIDSVSLPGIGAIGTLQQVLTYCKGEAIRSMKCWCLD